MLLDLSPSFLRSLGVEAVLFDKDGTLLDSLDSWAHALSALCAELARFYGFGSELQGRLLYSLGIDAHGDAIPSGLLATGTTDALLRALLAGLLASGVTRGPLDLPSFSAQCSSILTRLYPSGGPETQPLRGADRVLKILLGQGFPLGIASSDDEARTSADLARLHWDGYFSFVSSGDTALAPKPDPWPLIEFARVVDVPPSRIAVVGDSAVDRQMAMSGGARLFLEVTDGYR